MWCLQADYNSDEDADLLAAIQLSLQTAGLEVPSNQGVGGGVGGGGGVQLVGPSRKRRKRGSNSGITSHGDGGVQLRVLGDGDDEMEESSSSSEASEGDQGEEEEEEEEEEEGELRLQGVADAEGVCQAGGGLMGSSRPAPGRRKSRLEALAATALDSCARMLNGTGLNKAQHTTQPGVGAQLSRPFISGAGGGVWKGGSSNDIAAPPHQHQHQHQHQQLRSAHAPKHAHLTPPVLRSNQQPFAARSAPPPAAGMTSAGAGAGAVGAGMRSANATGATTDVVGTEAEGAGDSQQGASAWDVGPPASHLTPPQSPQPGSAHRMRPPAAPVRSKDGKWHQLTRAARLDHEVRVCDELWQAYVEDKDMHVHA